MITWSARTLATGGFFFSAQPSHDVSFLHEIKITTPTKAINNRNILFIFL
jgi:hypothetical protein